MAHPISLPEVVAVSAPARGLDYGSLVRRSRKLDEKQIAGTPA